MRNGEGKEKAEAQEKAFFSRRDEVTEISKRRGDGLIDVLGTSPPPEAIAPTRSILSKGDGGYQKPLSGRANRVIAPDSSAPRFVAKKSGAMFVDAMNDVGSAPQPP